MNVNVKIHNSGILPGTSAWLINQINDHKFYFSKTKSGKACVAMKKDDEKSIVLVIADEEPYEGWNSILVDDYAYQCVFPTGGDHFQGMFNVVLSNAALKAADKLIEYLARALHDAINADNMENLMITITNAEE